MPTTAFQLEMVAEASLPTRFGLFRIYGFRGTSAGQQEEAVALVMGDLAGEPPLVRVHSQCLTGDVFHSLRCDCRQQFELAMQMIASEERGVLIYEQQEGRGIGLLNKLRAYQLQDLGADTVEANEQLGFAADLRGYNMPGEIIRFFGLEKIRLISNNPRKVEAIEKAGIKVVARVPATVPALDSTEKYLQTKREKLGHLMDL